MTGLENSVTLLAYRHFRVTLAIAFPGQLSLQHLDSEFLYRLIIESCIIIIR